MLPQFQTKIQELSLMQNQWAQQLNQLLACPLTQGQQLTGVDLAIGSNVINHKLGRKLQGWIVVGIDAAAQIYDEQATNQMPAKTLVLNSDATCTVSLWVY